MNNSMMIQIGNDKPRPMTAAEIAEMERMAAEHPPIEENTVEKKLDNLEDIMLKVAAVLGVKIE